MNNIIIKKLGPFPEKKFNEASEKLLNANAEKCEHSNRIEKLKVNTEFSQFRIKGVIK